MNADAVVYEGEPDKMCAASNRSVQLACGGFSGDGVPWVSCPDCGANLPHRSGYDARSIPAHNAPRILSRRPRWVKEAKP